MIDVKLCIDEKGILHELTAEGHAEFDVKGKDIVCSSVFILLHSAYLSLFNLKDAEVSLTDERLFCIRLHRFDKKITGELRGITLFLRAGLEALARNYAEYVSLTIT